MAGASGPTGLPHLIGQALFLGLPDTDKPRDNRHRLDTAVHGLAEDIHAPPILLWGWRGVADHSDGSKWYGGNVIPIEKLGVRFGENDSGVVWHRLGRSEIRRVDTQVRH